MFKRYPYWGWLLLSIVLWCINGYNFHRHRQVLLPERMCRAVNNDIQRREGAFEDFIVRQDLIGRLFKDSITTKEANQVNNFPFYVFGYIHDTLKFWNTNLVVATFNDSATGRPILLRNEKGVFVEKCVQLPGGLLSGRLVILFPILITYPLENDYLRSHFAASEYIPVKAKIIPAGDGNPTGNYPVTLHDNIPVFSLHFNPQDIQKWTPDLPFIIVLLLALLASISWVQLMIIYLTRNQRPVIGFLITLAVVALLRSMLFIYGLPFNLDLLTFYSPQLYAYNRYLSSFGDLFIDMLGCLWVILFVIRHTPYKRYFDGLQKEWLRYLIAFLLVAGLLVYMYLFVNLVRSLVLDSNISFDVNHFYAINVYSLLGLFLIGVITGISCLVMYLLNVQLNTLIKNKKIKYFLSAVIGVLLLFFSNKTHDAFHPALLGWCLLFIALLDQRKFALVSDLFEPHMIFWAVFICAFSTGILQYFNQAKEREQRKAFVEQRLSPRRDIEMEYSFHKIADNIGRDKALISFFLKSAANTRKIINQRFEALYLTGALSKYQPKVYLFDDKKRGLYNIDTVDFNSLFNELNESVSTNSPYLFYKESILDRPYYLSYITLYNDSAEKILGYVIIDLDLKKQISETVYPELLQPIANKVNPQEAEYSYAVYVNDKLITQANDHPFTTYLKNDTLKDQAYAFYNNNDVSELYYKVSDKRTIVVAYSYSEVLELISLFSYLFGVQVVLALIIFMYQLYLSYSAGALFSGEFFRLTLRKRVHFSVLVVVLVSFVFIGIVTIGFFTDRYRISNSTELQSAMQVAKQSVQDYLKQERAYDAGYIFDSVSRSTPFKYFITNLASGQKIDINIFNENGILYNASEDDIYNKGLISRMMRPDAFYQLNDLGKSIVLQNERVAGLSYLSAYEPLRDERGKTLGYINVPFFSSEKDLNFQISNIVVTLINLYAFIFLFSSVITVFITRWITRSFNIIIQQFGRLNLQQNERITWSYNDEIGLLVNEYNKMVNKVEENAALLAQSERESAWREMARQVAHEIKNPLTPMKLNIQYLQQAMKNDNPGIKELTNKVSDSIIEQIDNLSYIASEFSNFAKMPEARPEELELNELLNKAVELYMDETRIKVTINKTSENLLVFSDRSQLLRVFTNLLENAKQAIPMDRAGKIDVSVLRDKSNAIIIIADNGNGIPEEVSKKIFQPYFTTKTSGTGLGLAMTRKIIEFWKGTIWFETDEGKGTIFYIRLPLIKLSDPL